MPTLVSCISVTDQDPPLVADKNMADSKEIFGKNEKANEESTSAAGNLQQNNQQLLFDYGDYDVTDDTHLADTNTAGKCYSACNRYMILLMFCWVQVSLLLVGNMKAFMSTINTRKRKGRNC